MKSHRTIAAGTALALLMASPVYAAPLTGAPKMGVPGNPLTLNTQRPVILAQASIEDLRRRLEEEELSAEERQAIEQQIEALENAAPPPDEPPAEEPAAEEPAAEEPAAEEPPVEEPAVEEAPAEQPAAEEAPAEPAPEEAAPDAPADEPAAEEAPAEQPAAEEPAAQEPAVEEPAAEEAPAEAPAEEPAAEEAPAEEAAPEAPAEAPAAEETPAEEPTAEEAPAEEPAAEEAPAEEPAVEETPAEEPAAEEAPADEPAAEDEAAADDAQEGEAAPVLDSQKEAEATAEAEAGAEAEASADTDAAAEQEAEAEQAPPPESDAAAQAEAVPAEVESATAAEGTRVEESQARGRVEQRSDAEVIGEIAGRIILSLAGRPIVESDDRRRLRRGAEEIYYEELRFGRTRETIIRRDGTQIVTIRDRYGDVIRRSRITPDGREYILIYAGDRDRDDDGRRDRWRDPGRDLPPLRLRIPVREYILDAERVDDPDRYYQFLDQPPVEPVRRLYSVDEVKYSARIRDTMRRVDLDNITFDFGSATISESEIAKLEGIANAMTRMLDENPAETFLIEGHTDAVGSQNANLSLSDRRAETVAAALSEVFEIPPENLVTQGYGETYLKVKTEEPNRTNRRVAVRRITPLVAPVASR